LSTINAELIIADCAQKAIINSCKMVAFW